MHAWKWKFTHKKTVVEGTVQAVDARDAISRALTSDYAGGLLGEKFKVPIEILDSAYGDSEHPAETECEGFRVAVSRT